MLRTVKMAFKSIDVSGPELPERSQPVSDFLQWLWVQPVESALCVNGAFDEAGVP